MRLTVVVAAAPQGTGATTTTTTSHGARFQCGEESHVSGANQSIYFL
jgi:hypothetical protein